MNQISLDSLTRPQSLDDVVGMEDNKNRIVYDIRGAQKRNIPYPSYIIDGPAGTGKSTIADIIAIETEGNIHKLLGADFKNQDDIRELALRIEDGDVVFVEEAHTVKKGAQEALLEWIEKHHILGGAAYGINEAPKVCFIFPTTNSGKLSDALRSRCRKLTTSYYSNDDLCEIIKRVAYRGEIEINDEEGIRLLAQSSRGSPRIAVVQRLDPVINVMEIDGCDFTVETVEKFFRLYGINQWGLEGHDIQYCHTLYDKMRSTGKPVGITTLRQSTGLAKDIVDNVVEPYLQQAGIIQVDIRGRTLTEFGYSVINKPPLSNYEESIQEKLDEDSIMELLKDPVVRIKGMRELCSRLKLNYPKDSIYVKQKLEALGFQSRQKAGIIKI